MFGHLLERAGRDLIQDALVLTMLRYADELVDSSQLEFPSGAKVRKGAAVCEVIDPADARGPKARTQVLAGTDGILFSRKLDGRLAWPGAVLFRIAGAKLLEHRKGLSGLDD